MSETGSTDVSARPERSSVARPVAVAAVFVALAVALGYLLAYVPNVELITFTVFAAGAVLGKWRGAAVGATAMALYSSLSPFGSGLALPPLFAAQVLGTALVGFAGGLSAPLWFNTEFSRAFQAAVGGALGFAVTLVYQSLVVLGLAAAMPEFRTGLLSAVLANAFFSSVHLLGNTVVFTVLAPTVLPRLGAAAVRRRGGEREGTREEQ